LNKLAATQTYTLEHPIHQEVMAGSSPFCSFCGTLYFTVLHEELPKNDKGKFFSSFVQFVS